MSCFLFYHWCSLTKFGVKRLATRSVTGWCVEIVWRSNQFNLTPTPSPKFNTTNYYPGQKKRTILEIRGEKNAVPRVISCSITSDQRRARSDLRLCATFALRLSCLIEHDITRGTAVLLAANLDDGSFFLSRVVHSYVWYLLISSSCSSIVVHMMLCITPRLFLVLHVASPVYCISFFSSLFPCDRHFFMAFNCIKSVLDNRFPMSNWRRG